MQTALRDDKNGSKVALGLDEHAVAKQTGINSPWYYDLEASENDLAMTLSLEKLCHLARVVQNAINQALCLLGVSSEGAHDEFDAVDLGKHRDTADRID